MNTENASKYLGGMQINDRSVWDSKDIEHPLECLLEDYHQEQLKLLGITNVVGQSEQLACEICELHKVENKGDWCDRCLEDATWSTN